MATVKINKVKAFREALEKPQHEIAKILGVSQPSYNRKEKNRRFTDEEKVILTDYFKKYFPNETLESIFF